MMVGMIVMMLMTILMITLKSRGGIWIVFFCFYHVLFSFLFSFSFLFLFLFFSLFFFFPFSFFFLFLLFSFFFYFSFSFSFLFLFFSFRFFPHFFLTIVSLKPLCIRIHGEQFGQFVSIVQPWKDCTLKPPLELQTLQS